MKEKSYLPQTRRQDKNDSFNRIKHLRPDWSSRVSTENRKWRVLARGFGTGTCDGNSPTTPSGALQLWQKHWSTESRTRPISILSFHVRGLSRVSRASRRRYVDEMGARGWKGHAKRGRRDWKDEKRTGRRVRHAGSVASVRIWGGGWWATGLHAAPRRPASLNTQPPSSQPSLPPHPATNGLPDDKPPFQRLQPAIATSRRLLGDVMDYTGCLEER